jgi:hypothetical protein
LRLDEEFRALTEKVWGSLHRDALEFVPALAARPDDLLQTLNRYEPEIVHFSGHGTEDGLILVGTDGSPKPVTARALKSVFTTLKGNIRLVVLNACYSRIQARAIVKMIDCVVGMNSAIGDEAAILFAAAFYRAIGFGRSVQEAFEQGKAALLLEDIPEENTPKLLVKVGVDPSRVVLLSAKDTAKQAVKTRETKTLPDDEATDYASCFISYDPQDEEFAQQLYTDLQSKGIRCWFAPEDLRIGEKLRDRTDEAIREHTKLLLVLSEHSVASAWVEKQVETAFDEEQQQNKLILFPIRLDDAVMKTKQAWAADIRRMRHIGDFTKWENHDNYQKALIRLLRDLKASDSNTPYLT